MSNNDNLSRIKKTQELMTERKIDALLLFEAESIHYLTNAVPEANYVHAHGALTCMALFVPQQGEPVVIVLLEDVKKAKEQAWIKDIRPFLAFPGGDAMVEVVGITKERGLEKATIGAEKKFLNAFLFEQLQQALPQATLVDASDLVHQLAASKSDIEIQYIEKAQNIAYMGMKAALSVVKEGVSELDIAVEADTAMIRSGAQRTAQSTFVAAGIERSRLAHPRASRNKIKKNDVVVIDLGAVYNGYSSDLCRTAVCGKPTAEQKEVSQAVLEAHNAAIEAAKSGLPVSQMESAYRKVIDRYGLGGADLPRFIGHGIGMIRTTYPYIFADAPIIIPENCTLSLLETAPFKMGIGQIRFEDVILVTSEGSRILGDQSVPRELISL